MHSFLCHAFFPPVSTWDGTVALYGRRLDSGHASLNSTVICGYQRSPCRQASITLSWLRRPNLSVYQSDNLFALTVLHLMIACSQFWEGTGSAKRTRGHVCFTLHFRHGPSLTRVTSMKLWGQSLLGEVFHQPTTDQNGHQALKGWVK